MLIYTVLSRLLDYPEQELIDNLIEVRKVVEADSAIKGDEQDAIFTVIDWMLSEDLIELQQDYVQSFDNNADNSLHLTHHLYGDDDRERGPALINIVEHFKKAGLSPVKGELPDYLPLILEYLAKLDEEKAGEFLGDAVKVLTVLAENLEQNKSPYAPLVRIVESHGLPYAPKEEE